jgi:hypothetical protein
MALPAPGTFSSLSAKTACYTYNWQNNIGEGRTITYLDCNGFAGRTQSAPAGQSGNFCARSVSEVPGGGVSVNAAGNCPCITWLTRLFNATNNATWVFSWLDCNGQPAQKTITTGGGPSPGDVSFYSCGNSKPVVIVVGGSYDLSYEAIGDGNLPPTYYCRRDLVG